MLKRGHGQGLAKPAGTCDEGYLVACMKKFLDKKGFVDKKVGCSLWISVGDECMKVGDPVGHHGFFCRMSCLLFIRRMEGLLTKLIILWP